MPRWEQTLFVADHYVFDGLSTLPSISGIAMLLAAGIIDAEALAINVGPRDQHEPASPILLVMFMVRGGRLLPDTQRPDPRMGVPMTK